MVLIEQVLDVARWAPSGDNTQPWRFQILSELSALIHGFDTRDHCVYDLDGHASRLSHGALLENAALAATRFGCIATHTIEHEDAIGPVVYRVQLHERAGIVEDPLARYIEQRTVQRRAMGSKALTDAQRAAL